MTGVQTCALPIFKRLQNLNPDPRPELAFQGTATPAVRIDSAIEIVAALTPDQRRVLGDLMPALPPEIGGGSSDIVIRNVESISARVKLPPSPSLTIALTLLGPPQNAARLKATFTALRETLLNDPEVLRAFEAPELRPTAGEIRALVTTVLTPETTTLGPHTLLSFQLTAQQAQRAALILTPSLDRARTPPTNAIP